MPLEPATPIDADTGLGDATASAHQTPASAGSWLAGQSAPVWIGRLVPDGVLHEDSLGDRGSRPAKGVNDR